jgi:hypothetical protein
MAARWGVSSDGRHLLRDGEPWFLLGDTAWELLRRLTDEEADEYLRVRAGQGYNTVLTVALSEFDGLSEPSVHGQLPFHDLDSDRPNEPYWEHADRVIRRANSYGLAVGLLPTWGGNWHDDDRDGAPYFTPDSARRFATWIARRYADDDVIWILGGDRPLDTPRHHEVIDAFAEGLRSVVGDRQLITFHPSGARSSSDFLPDADWLDFHMSQSGHTGWGTPNYQLIQQDYERTPVKPTLDSEPNYEGSPVMSASWHPVPDNYFDDVDVRRAAYHAVFYGAAGHVYGCHDVWQMNDPEHRPPLGGATRHWRPALTRPGAVQMGHLAALVRELDLLEWRPAGRLIRSNRGMCGSHIAVLAHPHGPHVLVYAPQGRSVDVDATRLPDSDAASWTARWWDPRTGQWLPGTERIDAARIAEARATGRGFVLRNPCPDADAVLLLEG